MYGPKPPAARRLAQPLADGGLVARMKSADAGPAPFGSRGLSQLRDLIPKMEAMGYKQQPQSFADGGMVHSIKGMLGLRPKTREELLAADAKAQARNQEAAGRVAERAAQQPAPTTPAPQAAISDYSGMNAMQRREKEQGLKDGGMIRGPGTGTSDSIPDEMAPGTYILPADTTKKLALDDKKVPVRVSNGEYELPPEQVQAVGAAVLDAIKGVTHAPKSLSARVMQAPQDEQFFAAGGMVENDVTRVGNSYSGGNVGGSVSINGQAGAGTMSTVPAPVAPPPAPAEAPAAAVASTTTSPATPSAAPAAPTTAAPAPAAPMGWAERNAQRSTQVTASSIMDSPERRAAQAKLSPTPAPVAQAAPTTPAVGGIQPTTTAMDATKPKPFGAQPTSPFGFKPRGYANGGTVQDEQFFSTGGSVQDPEELRKMIPLVEAMGYAHSPAAANRPAEPPAQPVAPAPAPAAPSEYSRQMSAVGGALADGAAWLGKTIVSAPGYGFSRPSAAPAPAQAPTGATTTAGAGRGAINPTPVNPTQPATAAPAPTNAPTNAPAAPTQQPTNEVMPGVYRHGRGQYSDNASGMGMPANFTGQPNAQNMAAGESLAARAQQASMGRALSAPAGFQPAGVQAPVVRNSTNDWAARKALENMATAASSITNRPEWQSGSTTIAGSTRGPKGEGDPEGKVAAYKAALANDLALQQAQPGLDQTAMRENAGITREGMQQEGATMRTSMQERGSNTRDARRNALTAEELALRREAQGFQTREAQQKEQLRNVLLDPKATPEQRAMAQRSLAALSNKTAADRMQTVNLPDTTNEMGQVVRGGQALVRELEDGTVQQVPIGGNAALPPMDKNKQAIAIRDNKSMSREQKVEALRKLGYQG